MPTKVFINSGQIVINDGSNFLVTASDGSMDENRAQGFFVHDTRLISYYKISLNRDRLSSLASSNINHHSALYQFGNLDSDANIAKLALALETDAAIAYVTEAAKLKIPTLIAVGAGIGSIESIHAARIRNAFNGLGMNIPVVPSAMISAENRELWILKIY